MGLLMARSKLSQVGEEEGKQGVMESKLVRLLHCGAWPNYPLAHHQPRYQQPFGYDFS
ncbi:hypothetical protein N7328_13680 [Aeromonas dhakensis]|nr:hypothetical protein [Aeromonas dhakensis]MDH0347373.1 hypothetical protein [Aeromonas dhakensis]